MYLCYRCRNSNVSANRINAEGVVVKARPGWRKRRTCQGGRGRIKEEADGKGGGGGGRGERKRKRRMCYVPVT